MINKLALGYENIVLVPKLGILDSRDQADTSVEFLGRKFKLPVVPSNMKAVINFDIASYLAQHGYLYVMHRYFDDYFTELLPWVKSLQNTDNLISISLGVKEKDREFVTFCKNNNIRIDFIWLDCAHGFAKYMESMIKYIKNSGLNTKVIAGNTWGDADSILTLEKWGADAIKSGLSWGRACITYQKTRIASPMWTAGIESSSVASVPLIADGGCRVNGDIALSIRAGYDIAMIGSMFSSCIDSPADDVFINGAHKKRYFGSASKLNKGVNKNIEGQEVLLDCNNMTYDEKLEEIRQDLGSAISYSGGDKLSDIRKMDYRIVL